MTIHFDLNSAGEPVRHIQRKLASLDPKGDPVLIAFKEKAVSGIYNADTADAVRAFRRLNGDHSGSGDCDEKTWRMLNEQAGSVFDETWQFEMDALGDTLPVDVEPVRENLAARAHRQQYAGLAFSGGGIRSATFNLGMLQALAELNMLRNFHFLSTVSGGGYIGAWFAKWLKRQEGNISELENELTPGSPAAPRREPEELKFLRQYTNYLTPKTGFFSADTWALLSTYVRNTTLNLTILALMLAAVMVIPRLLALFIRDAGQDDLVWMLPASLNWLVPGNLVWLVPPNPRYEISVFATIAVVAALFSVFWSAASLAGIPDPGSRHRLWRQSQNSIIWFIVLPQLVAAFFGSVAVWAHHAGIDKAWTNLFADPSWSNPIVVWLWLPGVTYFLAWLAGWAIGQRHNRDLRAAIKEPPLAPDKREWLIDGFGHFLCALTVLAVGAVLVVMTTSALHDWRVAPQAQPAAAAPIQPSTQKVTAAAREVTVAAHTVTGAAQTVTGAAGTVTALAGGTPPAASAVAHSATARDTTMTVPLIAFGIPIMLSLFGVTMILSVGLVGRLYTDKSREWWSRLGGWVAIFVMAWIALITVSLYAPAVVGYFHAMFGDWASALLGSAWLGTTLGGLLLGKSGATGAPNAKSRLDWLARAAPLIFSIGALCIVSSVLHILLLPRGFPSLADSHTAFTGFLIEYDQGTMASTYMKLWLTLGGLVLIGLLLAWRVDINKFSLHMMYRNRLVRAYLGASNQNRRPHPFTGFDPADDENLDDLLAPGGKLQKPYLIVNTALNLVNGKELAWQTRKAANFTFTPAFCGFELPSMASPGKSKLVHEAMRGGFRRTTTYSARSPTRYDEDRGASLGMAVAVSGAAASPSMGYHSSPPLAFLMTLFNVRLGRWFANPVRPIPKGLATRLRELTARVRDFRQRFGPTAPRALPQGVATHTPVKPDGKDTVKPPRTSPRIGLWYLLKELFGLTDATANFVYLSDGGHFENLGIYELVRRRCRLIVVIDAGADGQFDFEDLGNAIRKCGTDLHVEIEIGVGRIDRLKPAEFSQSHCVTGTIRYDKVDRGGKVGTLLYIKPSLLGTEYADVLNYRKTNKTFPHQPTADQWFDETQFETYRSLGYSIGRIALQKAAETAAMKDCVDGLPRHNIESLCAALHASWDNPDNIKEALRNAGGPQRPTEYRRQSHRRDAQPSATVIRIDQRKGDRRKRA